MEKAEKMLWRVVCVTAKILILFKTLSFGNLAVLRFQSPLSWPALNHVVSTTAYYSFTNPAILTWILGSTHTRRKIYALGFDYYIQILVEFEGMFYFDLFMPLLMRVGCLGWLAALVAFLFSLEKSSNLKKQVELIMAKWEEEDDDDDNKKEENGEQLPTEAAAVVKAEDIVLESKEDGTKKKEEEARREEMMRKVMEKWKKEKIRRAAYRLKWEKEKEEKAMLTGQLSTAETRWAEFCHTFREIYDQERRKWVEDRKELAAKLLAAQESCDFYRQLLHDCNPSNL